MPLVPLSLTFPPDAQELRAGDVDGDGRDELVVVSRRDRPGGPDAVTLTILHFGTDGAPGARDTIDLGARALFWDVDHGIWGLDGAGLVRIDPHGGDPGRLVRLTTPLASLGATTPRWAPLAHDLDGDGKPELVAWASGRWHAARTDGTALGSVSAPSRGALGVDWATGAASPTASLAAPPLAVSDLDGDGKPDLLLPSGARLAAYYTGASVGTRAATLGLPLDLEPPDEDPKPGETRRRVAAVWLEDIDGDGKTDLAVQLAVLNGSWFGSTTELSWARGKGDGFGPLTTIPVSAAAFGVELRDIDGDGDKDFLAPLVDVGIGTIARALLAKSVRVDLSVFRMEGGQFSAAETLRTFAFPLEQPDRFQANLQVDVDGDGHLDLVTNDAEDRVRVYRGNSTGLESAAAWDVPMRVPIGSDTLFVHDLTGDGRAEIIVWGPDETRATLLRVQ